MRRWLLPLLLAGCSLAPLPVLRAAEPEYSDSERDHWSLKPRSTPDIPQFAVAEDVAWVRSPIDAFILKELRRAELRPAREADRRTLARRLHFDLTGLPPAPQLVESFVDDDSPDAYERLIDTLLASPHYGERWGQHWLDVVRFAETEGFEYDRHRTGGWRYRDYVIASFNADKPYDRFLLEQLAGDELDAEDESLRVAAGFHRLGPVRRNAGNQNVTSSRNEVLTEMTDAVGSALLGLTVGCARCHDHMFDPIRQADYYRLQAFLASAHEHDVPLVSADASARWQAETDKATAEIKALKDKIVELGGQADEALAANLQAVQRRLPSPLPTLLSIKNDAANRTAIHLLTRGDPERKGPQVAPRALGVLLPDGAAELPADTAQPRTQLARWIIDPDHPLTARVIANRVWQYHFGQGLVGTPNDFGVNGQEPSHPELLDWLANALVDGGWRLKPLHRAILLSSTYRQASNAEFGVRSAELKADGRPANTPHSALRTPNSLLTPHSLDPDNRLLWRFNRRRLQAEEIRDAMLSVSGRLNAKAGGPSVMVPVEQELINLLYNPAQWEVAQDKAEHERRSIYLIAKRNLRLPFMEVFDAPDLQTSCGRRISSTHAPQALELLNGTLANDLAAAFAQRLVREAGTSPGEQIERAFLLAAGRLPNQNERTVSLEFLTRHSLGEFALAMFNLNDFLYVQ